MTTVRLDETRHKTYNVPVGQCSLNTTQDEHNFLDMHSNALTCLGGYNKKKERVPDGPTIKYSQGIQNSCIISSLASPLYYMGDKLASEYIIRRKQYYLACIHSNCLIQFCRDALMGQSREKTEQRIHYRIQEWNKYTTTYDILQNHSNYLSGVLFLVTNTQLDN